MADMADFLPLAQLVYSPFTFLLNYPYVMTESELAAQCLHVFVICMLIVVATGRAAQIRTADTGEEV